MHEPTFITEMHMHDPGVYKDSGVGVQRSVLRWFLDNDGRGLIVSAGFLEAFDRLLCQGSRLFILPYLVVFVPNADMQVGGFLVLKHSF